MKSAFFCVLFVKNAQMFGSGPISISARTTVNLDLENVCINTNTVAQAYQKFLMLTTLKNCGRRPLGPKYPPPPLNATGEPGLETECDIISNATYLSANVQKS